jgi:hypothetical protein
MKNRELDTILLANIYLLRCKLESAPKQKQELARKFLTSKIEKTLKKRKITESSFFKVFSFFIIDLVR